MHGVWRSGCCGGSVLWRVEGLDCMSRVRKCVSMCKASTCALPMSNVCGVCASPACILMHHTYGVTSEGAKLRAAPRGALYFLYVYFGVACVASYRVSRREEGSP